MGSVIDCGVGLNTKTSPRRTAIEKAQEELRQEYDVREERKRELEFLEKGGNPLDFKFGNAASISLQSTSFTDQRDEQYEINEARGSFALAASPHGDSIESSGRPGESLGRETNTADNLLLFDGENNNPAAQKIMKRTGKRGNACILEQSSDAAGGTHAKETEDFLIFHLGVKSQAYSRRNRSKSSRDGHGYKSTAPSSFPDHRDGNRSIREARAEEHGASYVSNPKPASPKGNVLSKACATDNELDMELDGVQTHHASAEKVKDGVREAEVDISDTLQNTHKSNQRANSPGGLVVTDEATSVCSHSVSLEPTGTAKDISSFEGVNGSSIPDKDVTGIVDDEVSRENCDIGSMTEVKNLSNVETDTHAAKEDTSAGNANSENCVMVKTVKGRSNGEPKELVYQKTSDDKGVRENGQSIAAEAPITAADEPRPTPPNLSNSTIRIKDELELCDNKTDTVPNSGILKRNGEIVSKPERKLSNSLGDNSHSINKMGVITSSSVVLNYESPAATLSKRGTSTTSAVQNSAVNHLKLAKKAREDAILKEARIIEANLRTAQLSSSYKSSEKWRKCHWDFVLEEMAWMANDFMQERLWKTATAAHICHRIASSGRSQFEQEIIHRKQRTIARTLAKAVMHFWHCVGAFRLAGETANGLNGECNSDHAKSCEINGEAVKDQGNKDVETGNISLRPSIQGYAIRFLEYDCSKSTHPVLAEAPPTPERVNDAAILEKSWEGELSEESLFYTVPPGAMQAYREAVESQWLNYKKMVSPMRQEDCEASPCDSLPDGPRKSELEEEEGETGSYLLPGAFEGTMSSKFTFKRKKIFQQKYAARAYNVGSDFSYDPCLEGKSANRPLTFIGKRPSSTPNAGLIPTKRVRTASRQRVVGPFGAGATGSLQITNKTDVSSGDTNSLQDDQSSMHGGSQSQKNMEVESTADFEKQFPFDSSETSTKSKKKKFKHSGYSTNLLDSGVLVVSGKGSMFDQRLQADSMVQQEQRDQVKRRLESQHHESNGNIGIYGQHVGKKPKLLKQPSEQSHEGIMPATGSIPSPVASQMSNMPNQNKFIKIIANRDRGKKSKTMKMAAGQSGSGILWTTFEDQALVVFVHDMGPNWELVSDAINNTLQFKCIFRKPQECKERHKILMDKSACDGADSADDSGSSQSYPSTLPGIPKGSARQLFQRLQGPMEEDTLKSHFEKIILIGQKIHSYRSQKDTPDQKQMTQVHSSHFVALSQTCPNNLGGGVLSPLDLCDAISSSPDVLTLGFQGSHTNGAAIPSHQGALSPVLSTSGASTMLPGSSGMVLGSNLPSPSTPLNAPVRDGQRYCVPRAASLPVDQHKVHYAQMLSGRNIHQSSVSVPGALPVGVDRGAHILPAGNGMGMMGGRTMPMSRPGFQGIISPRMSMVSISSMPAGSGGMPNSASIQPGAVSGPVNSMLRPRAAQNTEDHRQMMLQDLQMQASQGNGQGDAPFGAMSAPFSTTTGLPPVQSYPTQQHQQSHQIPQQPHVLGNPHHPHIQGVNHSSPQQQAYAMRLAKEKQLQQRIMPQSQQQYSSSSSMPLQSSSQIQQQPQTSSCATPTSSQAQRSKQQMSRNSQSSSGMPNQIMKQRQRQQAHQQQPRHQQQQKQLQQQQTKLAKDLGGGTMSMHQNPAADPSQVSSMPVAPRNQVPERHLMQQGPGFFPGSSDLNSTMPQSANHQKLYSRPPPQPSKQMPLLPSHSDTCNQSSVPDPSNHTLIASQQPPHPSSFPLAVPSPPQQQRQLNQNMPRVMLQQNRQLSSDGRVQSSGDQVQVSQMIPATSFPRATGSACSAPLVSSAMKWKPEPSYDPTSATPTAQLAGSTPGNLVGTDTLVPSSSDGTAQAQFSGSVSVDGHGVGGQWQPSQQSQSQPQLQQQQQPQHPHRQGGQGNLYARPSNSGPG